MRATQHDEARKCEHHSMQQRDSERQCGVVRVFVARTIISSKVTERNASTIPSRALKTIVNAYAREILDANETRRILFGLLYFSDIRAV